MMKSRCQWCEGDDLYIRYHDEEWGNPVHDDLKLFEFILLESAQAGLSWITILRKRENYRKAFDEFDPVKISQYNDEKIESLMQDKGLVRNRRKIESAVRNAKAFLEIQQEFGSFDRYIWEYVGNKTIINHFVRLDKVPAKTELSELISKDLKKRGFNFVGPVIVYAFMQAIGMVNDHLTECYRYKELGGYDESI
jgi:DNA-3-methyladenine glycosylase I